MIFILFLLFGFCQSSVGEQLSRSLTQSRIHYLITRFHRNPANRFWWHTVVLWLKVYSKIRQALTTVVRTPPAPSSRFWLWSTRFSITTSHVLFRFIFESKTSMNLHNNLFVFGALQTTCWINKCSTRVGLYCDKTKDNTIFGVTS